MNNQLFRKNSMQAISSPEQLNDYVRVASPGVWTALLAAAVLLAGLCVWGCFGQLETVVSAVAVSENGSTVCFVAESGEASVSPGMTVRLNGEERTVFSVAPAQLPESLAADSRYASLFPQGTQVYAATLDQPVADGVYPAEIVTEAVAPISFLWN